MSYFKVASILILTVGVLAALFIILQPDTDSLETPARSKLHPGTEEPQAPANTNYRITVNGGHRVSGPEVISAIQEQTLTIEFLSDQKGELHLHGYDIHLELQPNQINTLTFTASHAGRFEYELHGHHAGHAALGVIEVMPR